MKHRKKVKVLHVVGAMNRGGTETMLMNMYRNMDLEKFQFDFISYANDHAHYDEEIESLNGRIIRLTKTSSVKQIYQAIKDYGPYDAVHAHTLYHCGIVNVAAMLAGVKIRIAHAHTTSDKSDSYARQLYMTIMRFLITTFSSHLLACSKEAGSYLFGEKSITKQTYSYFPNAIDYTNFLNIPAKATKRFKLGVGVGSKSIVIGHIGTFKESKNHRFLVEIMKCLIEKDPTIHLLLVGDGELRPEIQDLAEREGLHDQIKFLGVRDNIPTIFHSMDVFVFPSIYEGLGLVLLEAQASGVPCLVSEAIQPEADIGLGLVETTPLAAGPDVWAEKVIQLATKRERNTNKIIDHFEQSGYSVTNGVALLQDLYKDQEGVAYEQDLDRLL